MNLLFYTHEFNLKEGRPCTKRIDSLASYLTDKKNNVTILTSSYNKANDNICDNRNYKIIYSYGTKNTKKNKIYSYYKFYYNVYLDEQIFSV